MLKHSTFNIKVYASKQTIPLNGAIGVSIRNAKQDTNSVVFYGFGSPTAPLYSGESVPLGGAGFAPCYQNLEIDIRDTTGNELKNGQAVVTLIYESPTEKIPEK